MRLLTPKTFLFILMVCTSCLHFTGVAVEAADKSFYLRVGAGIASSIDTSFSDTNCRSTSPAALFGCSNGNDGRAIGAYGDFGSSGILDLGIGYSWNRVLRTEMQLSYRPGFEFDGKSNFSQISSDFPQSVSADVDSFSAMVIGIVRPLALFQEEKQIIEPFIFGGLGGVYNRIESMEYTFPTTITKTPDGCYSGFAWTAGVGISYAITGAVELELAYRYSDLGKVSTDIDTMTIIRRSSNTVITDSIVINETEADLEVNEVLLSVTYAF